MMMDLAIGVVLLAGCALAAWKAPRWLVILLALVISSCAYFGLDTSLPNAARTVVDAAASRGESNLDFERGVSALTAEQAPLRTRLLLAVGGLMILSIIRPAKGLKKAESDV